MLEDPDATVGPCLPESEVPCFSQQCVVVREHAQDALGQATERLPVELIGPAEVVDHSGDGAAASGVPDVLGELEVADLRAVRVPAPG